MSSLDAPPFRRIAICGVGLIGGSLGLAIKRQWPSTQVVALDTPDVVRIALEMRAADGGAEDVAAITGADLIVLAAPVDANVALVGRLRALGVRALITDTGSTKRDIVAAAADVRFVGGHPIAGAATSGIRSARPDLFAGRPWILTPVDATGVPPALQALVEGLGARVRIMTPEAHDRLLQMPG